MVVGPEPVWEPMIDVPELARRLGRSAHTVQLMCRRGQLPYWRWSERDPYSFQWSDILAGKRGWQNPPPDVKDG